MSSNLTSASGEASASSGNRADNPSLPPSKKKKRNLPGNPDPEAEVIALSPNSLLATNRFVCEICNKGFQRDQNLQLHRRGHNLPWKLKKRTSKEVAKKVYVCPEPSCVHHDPSRALGDLTGIKKHFSRKHGEKKWKCDKCSKRYAVQSDWKAHSRTCGTREYRCDCGTLFSRRDSFITHRAFCDVLAEESARAAAITPNNYPLIPQPNTPSSTTLLSQINLQFQPQFNTTNCDHNNNNNNPQFSFSNLKKENQILPPWLSPHHDHHLTSQIFSSSSPSSSSQQQFQDFTQTIQNPNSGIGTGIGIGPTFHQPYQANPYTSATALLQKAAQMGATTAGKACTSPPTTTMIRTHQDQDHVSANSGNNNNGSGFGFGLDLTSSSSRAGIASGFGSGLADMGPPPPPPPPPPCLLQEMVNSLSSATSGFGDDGGYGGVLGSKRDFGAAFCSEAMFSTTGDQEGSGNIGNNGNSEGLTRDFLSLRPLSHSDIMNIAGLGNCINSNPHHDHDHNQNQITPKPWQG